MLWHSVIKHETQPFPWEGECKVLCIRHPHLQGQLPASLPALQLRALYESWKSKACFPVPRLSQCCMLMLLDGSAQFRTLKQTLSLTLCLLKGPCSLVLAQSRTTGQSSSIIYTPFCSSSTPWPQNSLSPSVASPLEHRHLSSVQSFCPLYCLHCWLLYC